MTEEEFKKTGKSGVYRPDYDEYFLEGEEPEGPAPDVVDHNQPVKMSPGRAAKLAEEQAKNAPKEKELADARNAAEARAEALTTGPVQESSETSEHPTKAGKK